MSIQDKCNEIRHRKVNLTNDPLVETNPHRPEMSVWADYEDDSASLALSIGPLFGQSQRFINLSPNEARKLAMALTEIAEAIDRIIVS